MSPFLLVFVVTSNDADTKCFLKKGFSINDLLFKIQTIY